MIRSAGRRGIALGVATRAGAAPLRRGRGSYVAPGAVVCWTTPRHRPLRGSRYQCSSQPAIHRPSTSTSHARGMLTDAVSPSPAGAWGSSRPSRRRPAQGRRDTAPAAGWPDWLLGRSRGGARSLRTAVAYVVVQVLGGIVGATLANAMFGVPVIAWSGHARSSGRLWLGEVVATAGLLLVILALARTGRAGHAPWAVGAYIGSAYWFTSSTSFANPAVTVGRAFTDTFAGIAPRSVPAFVFAQLLGGVIALGLAAVLTPMSMLRRAPSRCCTIDSPTSPAQTRNGPRGAPCVRDSGQSAHGTYAEWRMCRPITECHTPYAGRDERIAGEGHRGGLRTGNQLG